MKEITIRIITRGTSNYFKVIEEIRFNGDIIHETCIGHSKEHPHYTEEQDFVNIIKRIYDKPIRYEYYQQSKHPEFSDVDRIKAKVECCIEKYHLAQEIKALQSKYGYHVNCFDSIMKEWGR